MSATSAISRAASQGALPAVVEALQQLDNSKASSSAAQPGVAATFIFIPGKAAGALVHGEYATWSDLAIALNTLPDDAHPRIIFDNSLAPCVIPAGFWALLRNIAWVGVVPGNNPPRQQAGTLVQFAAGASVTPPGSIERILFDTSLLTAPAFPVTATRSRLIVRDCPALIVADNTAPLVQVGANAELIVEAFGDSDLTGSLCPSFTTLDATGVMVFDLYDRSTMSLASTGGGGGFTARVRSSAAGSDLPSTTLQTSAASEGYQPASLPNWNGTAPTTVAEALDRIAAAIGPIP